MKAIKSRKGRLKIILGILLVASIFYSTPYMTTYAIGKAATKPDVEKIQSMMDSDSIRLDMRAFLKGELAKEAKDSGVDLESLPAAVTATVVEIGAEKISTPQAIIAIVTGRKLDEAEKSDEANKGDLLRAYNASEKGYLSYNEFSIKIPHVTDGGKNNLITLHLRRENVISWVIYKVSFSK